MAARSNYKSREFLLAQHEADQARIAGLMMEIKGLKFQLDAVASEEADRRSVEQAAVPLGRKALMAEAKRLAELGTACYVRGTHIYAVRTHEVLV